METVNLQGELWGKAACNWADIQEPMNRPLWEAMLNAAQVGPGTRLLDVGCGGGGASVLAAASGANATGLDVAEGLIAFARERAPNCEFHIGDIEKLPFADSVFDVVFAANSIQFAGDWLAALRELGRVCAVNGRIAVGLFGPPEKVAFRFIFKTISAVMPEQLPDGGPFALSAPGKLEDLFEKAGLTVLASDEVDCPFVYPDFATFWRGTTAAGPFQRILPIVGEARLKSALRDAVESFCGGNDRILIQPNSFKYVVAVG